MPKKPTPEEFLSDPKYAEEKGFLKSVMTGIAKEVQEGGDPKKKRKDDDDDENFFDSLFGGK